MSCPTAKQIGCPEPPFSTLFDRGNESLRLDRKRRHLEIVDYSECSGFAETLDLGLITWTH